MAWVRFPDGSRRKVERLDKADAQRDLDELFPFGLSRWSLVPAGPAGDVQRGHRRLVRGRLSEFPERRASKERKSFTINEAQRLLVDAIPADSRPGLDDL